MSKIKALNEIQESSESEDEANPKLSKEAQEEQAKLKYNEALRTLAEGRKQDAAQLLEMLLVDPCLQIPDDAKQFAPFQQQLQLGCFKILADLYRDGECKDLSRSKLMYERAIYVDQDDNINLWYRLGKVCYEDGDLYSAHHAFSYALQLRPSHWGCLENMVTISYAVQDYIGCLRYCASGLGKDPNFFKGLVFRDLVYKAIPELKNNLKEHVSNCEALNVPGDYNKVWADKYLSELKKVEANAEGRIVSIQKEISFGQPKINLQLKSLTLIEIVREVLAAYEEFSGNLEFHKDIELTWTIQDSSIEPDDLCKAITTEESQQTEEESQSAAAARSRSSSDDKENVTIPNDGTSASQQELNGNGEKKTGENISENSQPLDGQGQQNMNTDEPGNNKKKSKGNVKWWQMEGKRRSQRVRGHLIPVSPEKAKKESSFADQLKNLIPASLLGDDGSVTEKERSKSPEKGRWQKKLNLNYFGTKDEEHHVKQLLAKLSIVGSLPKIIIKMAQFLTSKVKYPWPLELRDSFLAIYKYYRSHTKFPHVLNYEKKHIVEDAYVTLTYLEIAFEKYRLELCSGDKYYLDLITKEIYFIEDCQESKISLPRDFNLRGKWLIVRRLLNMANLLNSEEANEEATKILKEIEAELRIEPLTIWLVNETSNLICLETVTEKSAGITKMRNSQLVTDLYQREEYESLIGILQSCINFCEIENRDLPDIHFYTVALFHTNNTECINQCVNLINLSLKFQENNVLDKSIILMEEIWEKLKTKFTLQDKRLTVGALIKVLVACEGKPPSQESILCIPWCILHSITFSLEREEPVLYLEEDTLPNSILLLQMAHECMARSEKCCIYHGRLMLYTMKAILQVKKSDEYIAFEETRYCMEQAIFCLYSHPSKKSKAKNLKDHNSTGITLSWEMCPLLYQYYIPDEIPEFDSFGSIGAEVESLFQRLLEIMPKELNPTEELTKIRTYIETCDELKDHQSTSTFPSAIQDIYYLIGDYYFKSKEWSKAVNYYMLDLAIVPSRFDSWAAIALSLGENINTTLNTADVIDFKDLLKEAKSTAYCFRNALKFDPSNVKLRIEFGSFVYAMHAYCSRQVKHQTADVDMGLFQTIEEAKEDFLKSAFKCFEPIAKDGKTSSKDADTEHNESAETIEDEMWIHHYMLGKIIEKRMCRDGKDSEEFLKQYEIAGKLLHDQGAPYPAKMNYYSPPELAIEALEIYYRIHASILTLAEHAEYSLTMEKFFLQFIRRLENSPFVKSKQRRGDGGEGKRGRKTASEESISKKEMAEVKSVMKDLLDKAEELVEANPKLSSGSSGATSTTSTDNDDSSNDSVTFGQTTPANVTETSPVNSFSLSEFRKRLQEKELRQEKLACATEAKKVEGQVSNTNTSSGGASDPSASALVSSVKVEEVVEEEDIYEGLNLEANNFYEEFKDVKFGAVIALCLKAMEECISRYPSHFKSYYRLAQSYMVFLKDAKKAKDYLMGSPELSQRKITGLFGDRKANNFFNGIWRNPIDDIDRPGSFSYHMNKIMQLLLDVLSTLNDHQLLVEIVLQLAKIPDNEKKYLSNPDREMFCQQASNCCVVSVKRRISEPGVDYQELGIEAFETYTKLQKHSSRQNPLGPILHEIYKAYLRANGVNEVPTMEQAIRFFTLQQMALKASRSNSRTMIGQNSGDQQRVASGGDGPAPRKRGRRPRVASQEGAEAPQLPSSQDMDIFNAVSAAFQANNFIDDSSPPYHTLAPSITSLYPTMNMGAAVHSMINPLFNNTGDMGKVGNPNEIVKAAAAPMSSMKEIPNTGGQLIISRNPQNSQNKTPQPAHESSKGIAKQSGSSQTNSAVNFSSTVGNESSNHVTPVSKPGKNQQLPQLKLGNPLSGISSSKSTIPGPGPSPPYPRLSPAPLPAQAHSTPKTTKSPSSTEDYPPMPPLHPIRINTSPYKTQSTAVEQPPPFQFAKQKNSSPSTISTDSRSGVRKNPPVAHASANPKRRKTEEEAATLDVMDLTVKTPEKEHKTPNSVKVIQPTPGPGTSNSNSNTHKLLSGIAPRIPTPPQMQVTRVTTAYPLPPKKKHQQMLFRPSPPNSVPPPPPREDANANSNASRDQDNVEMR